MNEEMKEILVYQHHPDAVVPQRNHDIDAGLDLYSITDIFIPYGTTVVVPTGLGVRILPGFVGIIEDRSGMGRKGLAVAGGVIDALYTGSCDVILHNLTCKLDHDFTGHVGYQIKKGDRIAQLVVYQCALPKPRKTDKLWTSERGNKGFSSSGR